jgi:hypothetical protein
MIIVTHSCTRQQDERCPVIQLDDNGAPRCAGCINDRLNVQSIENTNKEVLNGFMEKCPALENR